MKKEALKKQATLPGIILTLAGILFFGVMCWVWIAWFSAPQNPARVPPDSRAALANLRKIRQAQSAYIQTDWDGDGEKTYAAFLTRLWRTPGPGETLAEPGLIPEKLAFALSASRALDGHYYKDVKTRLDDSGKEIAVEPATAWAIAAIPVRFKKTGETVLLADATGRIFSRIMTHPPADFPQNPENHGWKKIKE